ncbi:hypothetical protein MRX96_031852 [Rhipicephalus microplus]
MCSVSETATHQTMYPGDGICDILMYTDVRLLNETFEELIVPASYQLFLELSAKTYKKTTCGISLDVRYDFKDSYNTLKATVTKLTSDDVTVVVIITCVLTVRSLSTCKAMPASAWDPKNSMVSSMSCEGSTTKLQSEKVMAGINTAVNRTFFITFDSLDTMKEKAHLVMSSKDRKHKFTWFLFNVHLTDVTNLCFTPKPGAAPSTEMQRLKKFREFYYAESQKSLHTEHGFVLVCKTYYSEIQSWFVAQGFSLFDLMISGLFPDDLTMFANVAERTITKHFRCYMTSLEMSMNSMAAMFSWTKGVLRSTKLDNDSRLVDFARMLEKAVAQLFLSRYMTQDIEMCSEGLRTVREKDYLNTLYSIANVAVQMASVYKQVFMEEAIPLIVAFFQHRAAQHVWLICLRFAVSMENHLIF